jgi:hypothetical protein
MIAERRAAGQPSDREEELLRKMLKRCLSHLLAWQPSFMERLRPN